MTSCHVVLRAYRAFDAILGHVFRFRWDLWVFTYVAWSMIDDYMSPDFRPIVHLMPILGHVFRFRWDLWVFTYVAWSMIDDFMSPDFRPVVHLMPYRGIFSFWVRFTDLHGGHVLDDRWFHDICPSDLSRTWCHCGPAFFTCVPTRSARLAFYLFVKNWFFEKKVGVATYFIFIFEGKTKQEIKP